MAEKYLFIEIAVQNGEYREHVNTVQAVSEEADAREAGESYAKEYYGGEENEGEEGHYYSDAGCICTSLCKAYEISKQEFEILRQHI